MDATQPCPVVERCGGCPLLLRTAVEEHAIKREALRRLQLAVGLSDARIELTVGSSRVDYRNRIRLRIDASGQIAFFNSEKSPDCAVLLPALRNQVSALRDWSSAHREKLAPFAHLEARVTDLDGRCGLYLTHHPDHTGSEVTLDDIAEMFANQLLATDLDIALPYQRFDIDGTTFQYVPLDGFLQVNFEVNRHLTRHVVNGALSRNLTDFADLYCGSGNFTLPLAKAGLLGRGVERGASCRIAATRAASEQGLRGIAFSDGDSVDTAERWVAEGRNFDLVVVDPPRAGIREGLDVVAALARRHIVYCSCNPDSLLRDLDSLQRIGWCVDHIHGFDMFPGTVHIEIVAWLSRTDATARAAQAAP